MHTSKFGLIESFDAKEMLTYQHSGFSVDAGVCIQAHDRAALERPAAVLRAPTHHWRGRGWSCATGQRRPAHARARARATQARTGARAHHLWAVLVARIYEVFPLACPLCGGPMRIIAFITHSADIRPILEHIGVESEPPHIAPARGPPLWEDFDVDQHVNG